MVLSEKKMKEILEAACEVFGIRVCGISYPITDVAKIRWLRVGDSVSFEFNKDYMERMPEDVFTEVILRTLEKMTHSHTELPESPEFRAYVDMRKQERTAAQGL